MQNLRHLLTKPALLIVDMQRDFVQGSRMAIVPHIVQLREIARSHRIPTIFVQEMHRKSGIDYGIEFYFAPPHTREGTQGAEIIPELQPAPSDFVITYKRRYSAFFETDLELLLRSLKVRTLIMAGVATEVCVLATAFDAFARDFFVIIVEECVGGLTPQGHEGTLHIIKTALGKVVRLEELEKIVGDVKENEKEG